MDVRVPDIGDFTDVPVIEIHVAPGDTVAVEDPLVTLESDKATMDVPAPVGGVVRQLQVSIGDRVSEGSVLLVLDPTQAGPSLTPSAPERPAAPPPPPSAEAPAEPPPAAAPAAAVEVEIPRGDHHATLVVLGAGPGGYTAAFRAADLGVQTILIERDPTLGGVCLNVGCIPSKALLHAARVIAEAAEMGAHGVRFGRPEIDLRALRSFKQSVVDRLTGGLSGLARQRKVEVIHGRARFTSPHMLTLDSGETVSFEHCIVAAGSEPAMLPDLPDDPRIMDSTGALELEEIPKRLLVVGGGIIGLEMATVYEALGSRVTVVELLEALIPGCDPDLVRPLQARIEKRYERILLGTAVESIKAQKSGLRVTFSGEDAKPATFDRILIAVGRSPNGHAIAADAAGVEVDRRGFIAVDERMRTNVPHIHAIGDIVGQPMLAHKATHEAKVAAEVVAGHDAVLDVRAIPSVAYTDPEVAWMGLTETAARADGVEYEKFSFPWAASGRALGLGRSEGMTKLLFEPGSRRLLGAGIVGIGAGDLISETVHALELGANAEDLAATVHPHPTLSETVAFAAEMADGSITDLMPPRRRT